MLDLLSAFHFDRVVRNTVDRLRCRLASYRRFVATQSGKYPTSWPSSSDDAKNRVSGLHDGDASNRGSQSEVPFVVTVLPLSRGCSGSIPHDLQDLRKARVYSFAMRLSRREWEFWDALITVVASSSV
jgi:hypothetical protein